MTNSKYSRRRFLTVMALAPILFTSAAHAAGEDPRAQWDKLSPEQKALMLKRWEEFKAMPREQRDQLREAARHFAALAPEERQRIRDNWNTWKSMSPGQREKVRANYARFQALPPERKRELSEKYKSWRRDEDKRKRK